MVTAQIENAKLRQQVAELERRVSRQEKIILRLWPQIAGMQGKIKRLKANLMPPKPTAKDAARDRAEALFYCGDGRVGGTLKLQNRSCE